MSDPENPAPHKVTWAETVRDIALRMIDKGQWVAFVFSLILIIIILKLPYDGLERLLFDAILTFSFVPWVVSVILVIMWFFHYRYVDGITKGENQRLGDAKAALQTQLLEAKEELERCRKRGLNPPSFSEPTSD